MPIIKSAKKRVRQMAKAKSRNSVVRQKLRTSLKDFSQAVSGKKGVSEAHSSAQSALDSAVKKGVIHKNKAARKKRQLAAASKAAGIKVSAKTAAPKKVVKAPAKKKPATSKKTVAKK